MSTCRSHNFPLVAQNHKLSDVLERYSNFLSPLFNSQDFWMQLGPKNVLKASKNAK